MKPIKHTAYIALVLMVLTGCSFSTKLSKRQDGPPAHEIDTSNIPNANPQALPRSTYGNPRSYVALGKRYWVLPSAKNYVKTGIASWYGKKFHGQLTSSREPYNMYAMTAASPNLPLPTFVRVTNLNNGREIVVKVNDRGPFAPNRIIDLSYAAAKKLGMTKKGTAMVRVAAIDPTQKEKIVEKTTGHTPMLSPKIYLQLGAFQQLDNAKQLRQQLLQTLALTVQIRTAQKHAQTIYLVTVGPLGSVEQSDQTIAQLTQLGYTSDINIIN